MCLSVFDGRNIDQHIVPPNRTREFYMKNRVYTHFGQTQDECGADYELDQLYHNNRDTTPAFFTVQIHKRKTFSVCVAQTRSKHVLSPQLCKSM